MLLTVDVGNTTTASALFRGSAVAFRSRLPTPRDWSRRHGRMLLPAAQAGRVSAVIVSSVVPRLDRALAAAIADACGRKPVFLDWRTPTGIALEIDRPAELGADRIADCAGALALFPPPLVVIDSGTATTFDLVNAAGAYCGGCILPGIDISIRSLADHAAKLKRVAFSLPRSPVGTNTADGIRAGVFFGHVGALQHLIECYRRELGRGTKVVATGGLTRHFRGRVTGIDAYSPDLIFHGLRRIHEGLRGREE